MTKIIAQLQEIINLLKGIHHELSKFLLLIFELVKEKENERKRKK